VGFVIGLLNVSLIVTSLFLICLVLIQRGKGGGLAGAFGGVGGSSAFGTKAGDVFTKITIVVASVWIVLSMLLVILNNQKPIGMFDDTPSGASKEVPIPAPKDKRSSDITPPPSKPSSDAAIPPPPASGARPATDSGPPLAPPKSSLPEPLPDAPSTSKPAEPKKTP
jgi:preprotein translocase subunit SecG